jgi:hypothetical protein
MSVALFGNETPRNRLETHGRLDVFHVLGGQRRRRQAAALAVDALVVGQLAADLHGGVISLPTTRRPPARSGRR